MNGGKTRKQHCLLSTWLTISVVMFITTLCCLNHCYCYLYTYREPPFWVVVWFMTSCGGWHRRKLSIYSITQVVQAIGRFVFKDRQGFCAFSLLWLPLTSYSFTQDELYNVFFFQIAYVLTLVIPFPTPGMALGFFACGCAPGGGGSNLWSYLLGGDVSLSAAMTTISNIAAVGKSVQYNSCGNPCCNRTGLEVKWFHKGDIIHLKLFKLCVLWLFSKT